ncbi:MAG: Rne/Rng family ribonuclease [Bacillota bacterium]
MSKQIVINAGIRQKRAAILRDGNLEDILLETDTYNQIASNVYRGKVKDVLAGMQAAFIDIGIDKNAFLHISDIYPILNSEQRKKWNKKELSVQHVLQPGQEIMVQVVKEPIGSKGAKVSCKVTLPGRYLVLLPFENRTGISRRINDNFERNKLRNIARELTEDDGFGVIVRTNARNKDKGTLAHDYKYLTSLWQEINRRYKNNRAPALIYKNVELIKSIVRDYMSRDVDKVVIDDREEYKKLKSLTYKIVPELKNRIYMYDKTVPIFDNYRVEKEMNKIFKRKIWLNSGGYIIFDSTEALMSIDVNTGKFVGKKNLQDTVFKTNIEAAEEIARQLKQRDIGGIIIIDFIDMHKQENQQQVINTLEKELAKDRTKTAVLGFTQLGLVEMTRQKVREDLGDLIQKNCPYCDGTGQVMSETTMALQVIRKIDRLTNMEDFSAILLELHPKVAAVLIGGGGDKLEELEEKLGIEIYINGNKDLHIEDYNILDKGSRKKLRELALPVNEGEEYKIVIEEKHVSNSGDGIARLKGYIIIVKGAGHLIGEKVKIKIKDVHRTFARGIMV